MDTHSFLWFINGDRSLSAKARTCIEERDAVKYISIASFWEIAIKLNIGKLQLDMPFKDLRKHVFENGFEFLPLTFEHTAKLTTLKLHHRDPFDRIIISQALIEKLPVIGKDPHFSKYKIEMVW